MDKQTLMIAGGAVGAGFLTGFILQRFGGAQTGFSLPGSTSKYGVMAYQLGIPLGGAYLVKKFSPDLAKGMILGGLISVMQSVISMAMPVPTATAATAAYLSTKSMHALPPGYSAINQFGDSPYTSTPAFADAWAHN